jgi:four helix bundle protein
MLDKLEFKKRLEERTRRFAVSVFRFVDGLEYNTSNKIIGYQLGKASSSVGANYREANRAESYDDFIHKIGIVLKEISECVYWLELIQELRGDSKDLKNLIKESIELLKMFQSINRNLRTSKTQQLEKSKNRKLNHYERD